MPLTLASFRLRHEEFAQVADPRAQLAIDDALERTPVDVWGTTKRQELAQSLLAAHLLEISPFGRDARLNEDGETTYEVERTKMDLEQGPGAFSRTT